MLADRTYLVGSSPFNSRAVGSWQGSGQPITLTVYGPGGEVAVRALELAQELIQPAVVSIKTAQWGDTRGRARAAPQRDLRPCDPQCHRRRDRAPASPIAAMENREYKLPNPSQGAEIDSGR